MMNFTLLVKVMSWLVETNSCLTCKEVAKITYTGSNTLLF